MKSSLRLTVCQIDRSSNIKLKTLFIDPNIETFLYRIFDRPNILLRKNVLVVIANMPVMAPALDSLI